MDGYTAVGRKPGRVAPVRGRLGKFAKSNNAAIKAKSGTAGKGRGRAKAGASRTTIAKVESQVMQLQKQLMNDWVWRDWHTRISLRSFTLVARKDQNLNLYPMVIDITAPQMGFFNAGINNVDHVPPSLCFHSFYPPGSSQHNMEAYLKARRCKVNLETIEVMFATQSNQCRRIDFYIIQCKTTVDLHSQQDVNNIAGLAEGQAYEREPDGRLRFNPALYATTHYRRYYLGKNIEDTRISAQDRFIRNGHRQLSQEESWEFPTGATFGAVQDNGTITGGTAGIYKQLPDHQQHHFVQDTFSIVLDKMFESNGKSWSDIKAEDCDVSQRRFIVADLQAVCPDEKFLQPLKAAEHYGFLVSLERRWRIGIHPS